jgi:hypothetical protein
MRGRGEGGGGGIYHHIAAGATDNTAFFQGNVMGIGFALVASNEF